MHRSRSDAGSPMAPRRRSSSAASGSTPFTSIDVQRGPSFSKDARRLPASIALRTVAACIGWTMASSWAIIINKHILSALKFPYPIAVAMLGMAGTTVTSILYVRVFKMVASPQHVSWHFFLRAFMPIGLFMAVSFAAGNAAYLFLSVAFVQMLKAFVPVVTMVVAFAFGVERPSLKLVLAVVTITAGVAGTSYGEGNSSVVGVSCMLVSMAAEALRLVLMQRLMSDTQLHPIEALTYLGPACSGWLLLQTALLEGSGMIASGALRIPLQNPGPFLLSMCSGFAVNTLALLVISLASALTLKVLGMCKDVALVLVGVAFYGDQVSQVQLAGYCVSLSGFVWYNYLKFTGNGPGLKPAGGSQGGAKGHPGPVSVRRKSSSRDSDGSASKQRASPRKYYKLVLSRQGQGEGEGGGGGGSGSVVANGAAAEEVKGTLAYRLTERRS